MKTIKIFLSASEELFADTAAFSSFICGLNKVCEKQDVEFQLLSWYNDSYDTYNSSKYQEKYEYLQTVDIFVALFHKRAGALLLAEFDEVWKRFQKSGHPKVYVFFKELEDGAQEDRSLVDFKNSLNDLGYYPPSYKTSADLLMQVLLELANYVTINDITIQDGALQVDGISLIKIDKLQVFMGNEVYNSYYQKMVDSEQEVAAIKGLVEQSPEDETYSELLCKVIERYHKCKEKVAELQYNILEALRRIVSMLNSKHSKRLNTAINLFLKGQTEKAIRVLEEAESDADQILQGVKAERNIVKQSVDESLVRASMILADESLTIDERIDKVESIYEKARVLADECNYDGEEFVAFLSNLSDYARLLYENQKYKAALTLNRIALDACRKTYGDKHTQTALAAEYLGNVFYKMADYSNADKMYGESLSIRKEILGEAHPDVIRLYTLLGDVCLVVNKVDNAAEYYKKALELNKSNGSYNPENISVQNGLGLVYESQGHLDEALECYDRALVLSLQLFGENHPIAVVCYGNVGHLYRCKGDYDKALHCLNKAYAILKNLLGQNNPTAIHILSEIGAVYFALEDYEKTLSYWGELANIAYYIYGDDGHPDVAEAYNNFGVLYQAQERYDEALEKFLKALQVSEKTLGDEHPTTAGYRKNVSLIYEKLGNSAEAKKYYQQSQNLSPELCVYISTCREDYQKAQQFAAAIKNCGFQPIIDLDGTFTGEYHTFVSLLTNNFTSTVDWYNQFATALNKGKKIAIIQIEDIGRIREKFPAITNFLENWQDAENFNAIEERVARLLKSKTGLEVVSSEQRQRNAEADFENYEPKKNNTSIFISYRRKDGRNYARILELALKLRGFKGVFMDYTSLKQGFFNNQILDSIYSCDNFIFVATDESCEAIKKGVSSDDWVAKEVRTAVKYSRRIIPVVIEEVFKKGWPADEELSGDGVMVAKSQQRCLKDDEFFDDSIQHIVEFLGVTTDSIQPSDSKVSYKLKVNKRAHLYIDDEQVQTVEANTFVRIPLDQSQYIRKIVDAADETNFDESTIDMYRDKAEIVNLS